MYRNKTTQSEWKKMTKIKWINMFADPMLNKLFLSPFSNLDFRLHMILHWWSFEKQYREVCIGRSIMLAVNNYRVNNWCSDYEFVFICNFCLFLLTVRLCHRCIIIAEYRARKNEFACSVLQRKLLPLLRFDTFGCNYKPQNALHCAQLARFE